MLCISLYPRFLTEQAGKQRYKGHADKGNAAARHELLHALALCARIVVAVTLHEVDSPPNAKTCAKRDNQSLQYTNCAVKEIHINLAFCRFAAQKMLLKMKMPPLFLGGCVLVGQIYFVYVKGFIGLYDCRTGRHIPFHVKSVSFVEVGKVFVVRVFRDVVFVA